MANPLLRSTLLILMVGILSFPIIQDLTHILKPSPLNGAICEPVNKRLTWKGWWSGTYQDTMGEYAKEKTGVRPDLTRLVNQIDFSLFRKTHANSVVIGTDGYLYENGYITSYCGEDRLSYDSWVAKLYKVKMVQDTLDRLGVKMISIHAASKGSFFPEHFPADKRCDFHGLNNSDLFNHIGDSLGIRIIDFDRWFVSIKGKTEGHLFTKQGIHWSMYGATIAADSFIRYLRHGVGLNIPDMQCEPGRPVYAARETDKDIFDGLNIMQLPAVDTFYYPSVRYEGSNREKPKMIFIGDSFMWRWMALQVPQNISMDWEFWYYNAEVWTATDCGTKMQHYDWLKHLLKSSCVVIMYSDAISNTSGSGFIDNAYEHFYGNK